MVGEISVAVNLLWLLPDEVGGAETYAARLLGAIPGDGPLSLTLYAQRRFASAHPELAQRHRVVVSPVRGRSRAARVLSENTWLAVQCRRHRPSLVHHLGGTVPLISSRPSVVTIHDVQPLDYPKNFGLAKRAYLRGMLPWSARRAEAVVTVSDFCRDRLVERLGVSPEKVTVVPAPVDDVVPAPANDAFTASVVPALSRPFVFYPAIAHAHKNHAVLLRALAMLAERGVEVELVVTGAPGPLDAHLDDLAVELGVSERWHRLGRVPSAVLSELYQQAQALVFPSQYEGYGLPVVEAMAHRCPIVAADAAALPEVVASGGRLVDPGNVADWAGAIGELVSDASARQKMADAGWARLTELANADPVSQLLALYRQVSR